MKWGFKGQGSPEGEGYLRSSTGPRARVVRSLAPQCCGHWVNRISGLQVSLAQLNANTGACLYTVARVGNGSRISGLHLVTVLILVRADRHARE